MKTINDSLDFALVTVDANGFHKFYFGMSKDQAEAVAAHIPGSFVARVRANAVRKPVKAFGGWSERWFDAVETLEGVLVRHI